MHDPAIQVRIRAMDLLPPSCATDSLIVRDLELGIAATRGYVAGAWQPAAHALVALARLGPEVARPLVALQARASTWQLRMYAARAAQFTADTALLRRLAVDRDGNVREAAVTALAAVAGHGADEVFLEVLRSRTPQAVRAAALALKGSRHPDVRPVAEGLLRYWDRHRRDTERDARLALLDLLGRPPSADVEWNAPRPLPREVVALALGRMDTLTVALASGASFRVRLRGDIAPITAARVLALVDRGDYRGGSWHRVIPDFVIQGGLAGANEYVGGSHFFRDELGNLSHLRGGVGMSTRGHDTGDGQWFIDLSDLPRLDRDYTLFGEVIQGMDAVDGILEGEAITSITRVPRTR
jgi:cyclophilin family peptidyl-prolyl cis-trans isomerase